MSDVYNSIAPISVLNPSGTPITASFATSAASMVGFRSAMAWVVPGVISDGTHTPKLQECSTSGGAYLDVQPASLQGAFTALGSNTPQQVGYIGTQPYIRVFVTVSGATSGGYYCAAVILGSPFSWPASVPQLP